MPRPPGGFPLASVPLILMLIALVALGQALPSYLAWAMLLQVGMLVVFLGGAAMFSWIGSKLSGESRRPDGAS